MARRSNSSPTGTRTALLPSPSYRDILQVHLPSRFRKGEPPRPASSAAGAGAGVGAVGCGRGCGRDRGRGSGRGRGRGRQGKALVAAAAAAAAAETGPEGSSAQLLPREGPGGVGGEEGAHRGRVRRAGVGGGGLGGVEGAAVGDVEQDQARLRARLAEGAQLAHLQRQRGRKAGEARDKVRDSCVRLRAG